MTLDFDQNGVVQTYPRVSVIVPVRDDARLSACLDALEAQTYPPELVDIIVADNGSTPPVAPYLDHPERVSLVHEPRGGSYAARNVAAAAATGEVLAFTDSDCLPEASWIERSVEALGDGAAVVAGRVVVFARNPRRPHPIEAYELVHGFPQEVYVSRGGASVTANLITTREVFDAVGPFRDELNSGADIEWSQRANQLGYRTVYSAAAAVRHPARESYAAMWNKLRRVIRGRQERDIGDGDPRLPAWPALHALVPPFGAFRRARRAEQLVTGHARAAFVIGEFYHRYASAAIVLDLACRGRRPRRRRG